LKPATNVAYTISVYIINKYMMKRILLVALAILALSPALLAGDKKKKKKDEAKIAAAADDTSAINWLTIDEVQVAMKKQPKKVYMDVYTDWCGWCKVMDKKTFSNKDVIKYMNKNFYAVKFNAERQDSIRFLGKWYGFKAENRANALVVELMGGRMSYPTSIILEENFLNPAPIPGYLNVPTMEKILKYLGENIYKTVQYPQYEKGFTATWTEAEAPPAGQPVTGGH
jgi:thioredoxin-related protein